MRLPIRRPECRLRLGRVGAGKLRPPANAEVRDFVPHRHVMPDVSVWVAHGGHGTLTEFLAHGVPLVCLPNPVSDKAYLADRIVRLGAGLRIDQDAPAAEIRASVEIVLAHSSYRAAARAHRVKIDAGGAGRAADLLESLTPVAASN
jgi:UDP:flavonoid glycosyltransferase YjiC (YdhE family)